MDDVVETSHAVAALVTAPLRARRPGQPLPARPVREIAQARGTPIFDPENVNDASVDTLWFIAPELRTGIDFELAKGGTFSGTVVDSASGVPLPLVISVRPFVFSESFTTTLAGDMPSSSAISWMNIPLNGLKSG